MGKITGFLEIEREQAPRRAIEERVRQLRPHFVVVHLPELVAAAR